LEFIAHESTLVRSGPQRRNAERIARRTPGVAPPGKALMKRFVIGFVVGVGLMYYYLHYNEIVRSDANAWFKGTASKYRDDKQHRAAREVLGESERRP
jgi:hypothetical protein